MHSEVLSCKKTDKLLGVHIINAIAGDIISGACIGIEYGAASEEPFLPCEDGIFREDGMTTLEH